MWATPAQGGISICMGGGGFYQPQASLALYAHHLLPQASVSPLGVTHKMQTGSL